MQQQQLFVRLVDSGSHGGRFKCADVSRHCVTACTSEQDELMMMTVVLMRK